MKIWANHRLKILAALSTLLLALLALVAGLVYFLGSDDFRVLAADNVVRAIQGATGMETTLEAFEIDFSEQTFSLVGLEMRGNEDPQGPPFLSIERVDVGLRWRALINRTIDLTSLEVFRPRLWLEIGENGRTNVPAFPSRSEGGASGFEFSIGDLIVSEGQFAVNETREDIDFSLSALGGRFDYAEDTGVLSGHIEWAGAVAWDQRDIPYELAADFDYTQGVVLIQTMDVASGESRLRLQGRMGDVRPPFNGELAYTGSVDLPFMNHFFADEEFEGAMEVVGELAFTSSSFASEGQMTAPLLRFDQWTGTNVSSRYSWSLEEKVLLAEDFDADVFDGHANGVLRVLPLPGPSRVEVDLNFKDIDASDLGDLYPWDPGYVLDSLATGSMNGWFRGRFDDFDLSGEVAFVPSGSTTPSVGASLPVAGSTRFRGTPGQVEVDGLEGKIGSTAVEASGVVRAEGLDLALNLVSGDLADLNFIDPRVNGSGTFEGVLRGRIARPDAAGRFLLQDFQFEFDALSAGDTEVEIFEPDPFVIDRMEGALTLSTDVLALDQVRVVQGDSRIVLDGEVDLRSGSPLLDVEVVTIQIPDVYRFVPSREIREFPYPVTGALTGAIRLDSVNPVSASGSLGVEELTFEDVRLGRAEADFILAGEVIQLRNAEIVDGASVLSAELEYNATSEDLRLELNASGQELEALRWLRLPEAFQGRVRAARFEVTNTPTRPLIRGQATIDDLQFRQQTFDRALVTVGFDAGSAAPAVSARIETPEGLEIEIELNTFAADYPFTGRATFTDYDASSMTGMSPGTLRASGTARFDGELADFETIDGEGEVRELRVRFDEEEIVSPRFPFEFDAEEVRLSNVELVGGTTSIIVDGDVSLAPDSPIDLAIEGDVDLQLLSSPLVSPRYLDLAASGTLSLSGNLVGNLANPELEGLATLNAVSIGHPDLFLGLSDLNGQLRFDRDQVDLFEVTGVAGGGRVTLGGRIALEGIRPSRIDIEAEGAGIRVRTPEGLRTVFDATLSLGGTLESPSLDGNVEVVSLSFEESFEEFLAVFGAASVGALPAESGPMDALALAIHVEGERGIHIENELARVDARLDLDIGGTLGQPTLTGHVESVDGVLDLQGNRYLITRGNVDFADPLGIEPQIDVQAETELRNYRVILTITGIGRDVQVAMSSDPPLPQLEIVSLMAGGRTREELAGTGSAGAVPTSEELFQGAAATMVSDLLADRVGSRFGLGTLVRIDPFLVGAENDPTARVTISEQVTRDLIVTYSQDLSSNRQEIILIEYFLDNNTSFIASRDETGAVGLDIRLRKRFR